MIGRSMEKPKAKEDLHRSAEREETVESRMRRGAESKPSRRPATIDGEQNESTELKSKSAEAQGRRKRERKAENREVGKWE